MTLFSEKMLLSNTSICGFMPNLHKKSWTVSNRYAINRIQTTIPRYIYKMNERLPFLAYFCKHDTAKYCLDTLVIGVDAQQCPPRQPTKNQVS